MTPLTVITRFMRVIHAMRKGRSLGLGCPAEPGNDREWGVEWGQ